MQISQVGSMADLARLYQVRDTDGSGKLEAGEVPEEQVSSYDRDGDNGLSPWEVMEARGRQVFTLEQVESARNEEESITEAENPTIISSLVLLASSRIAGPLIVLSMIFTSSGCVSYQGNPSRFSNGQVFTGQLANNALVDGIRYRSGTLLMFHETGQVMQGTLAEGTRIQGFYFPAGTRITFTSAGRLEQVNTRSQPFLVQILSGGSFLWVSLRGIIRFHGNRSAILSARLARNTTIGGVLYRGGSEILLSEYGSFLGGTLVNDSEIRGIRYRQNTSISYHGNGRVRSGKLLENTSIRNVLFGGDDWQRNINFYANGQVRSGHLAENATIEGRSYRAGTHIMFHDNGSVSLGTLAEQTLINGRVYRARIRLSRTSQVVEGEEVRPSMSFATRFFIEGDYSSAAQVFALMQSEQPFMPDLIRICQLVANSSADYEIFEVGFSYPQRTIRSFRRRDGSEVPTHVFFNHSGYLTTVITAEARLRGNGVGNLTLGTVSRRLPGTANLHLTFPDGFAFGAVTFQDMNETIRGYNVLLGLSRRSGDEALPRSIFSRLRSTYMSPDLIEGRYAGSYRTSSRSIHLARNPSIATTVHELIHHWDLYVTGSGRSSLSQIYRSISWGRGGRRRLDDNQNDFQGSRVYIHNALNMAT